MNAARQLQNVDLMIDATREVGRVYYRLTDYAGAKAHFEIALRKAQSRNDDKRISDALHEMGRLAYRQGDMHNAENFLSKALSIRENEKDMRSTAQTLHELARVRHYEGKVKDAELLYKRSLELRKKAQDIVGQQATLHELGKLAFDQKDNETARKFYDECGKIARALNDRFWIAHNLYWNARLLWSLGDRSEAITQASQSLKICTALGIGLKSEVETWLSSPK
jgi:hypothetical protein